MSDITGTNQSDNIEGTDGNDNIDSGNGADVVDGGAGDDTISTGNGSDVASGGAGNDTISTGNGDDLIIVNLDINKDGKDYIDGNNGIDTLKIIATAAQLAILSDAIDAFKASDKSVVFDFGQWLEDNGHDRTLFDIQIINVEEVIVEITDNSAPEVVMEIDDQCILEDSPFTLDVSTNFDDPNQGDTITYAAELVGGGVLPGWLSFDTNTGEFSGTPENGDVGMIEIKVTASDQVGNSISDIFILEVKNVNDDPTLASPIPDQMVDEDSAFMLNIASHFADVDIIHGDELSYMANLAGGGALPSWLSFNATTGEFSGTPDNNDVGVLEIQVVATDLSGAMVMDTFLLEVKNVNDAPVLDMAIADQMVNEGDMFMLFIAGNFSDVDVIHGDVLSYSAELDGGGALPGWLMFDGVTGEFSGTPGDMDADLLNIRVTAMDLFGESVSDVFILEVKDVNDPPVAMDDEYDAVEDTMLMIPALGVLTNDVDTDPLTAVLVDDSNVHGLLMLNADGSFDYTPDEHFSGMASFTYLANDGTNDSNVATVTINVEAVADTPELTAIPMTIAQNRETSFDFLASLIDLDGSESLTLQATTIPAGVIVTPSMVNDGDANGEILQTITIDPSGLAADMGFTVTFSATATEFSNGDTAEKVLNVIVGESGDSSANNIDDEVISCICSNGLQFLNYLQSEINSAAPLGELTSLGVEFVATANFDSDAITEILVSATGNPGFLNYIDVDITNVTPLSLPSPLGPLPLNTEFLATADLDGDSVDEIVIRDSNNPNFLTYLTVDINSITPLSIPQVLGPIPAGSEFLAFADIDNDGIDEIIVHPTGSPNFLNYIDVDINAVTPLSLPMVIGDLAALNLEFIGMGDFNSDGIDDVLASPLGNPDVLNYVTIDINDQLSPLSQSPIILETMLQNGEIALETGNVDEETQESTIITNGTNQDDIIISFSGDDLLTGNDGQDIFAFSLADDLGINVITDFDVVDDALHFLDVDNSLDVMVTDNGPTGATIEFGSTAGAGNGGSIELQGLVGNFTSITDLTDAGVEIVGL